MPAQLAAFLKKLFLGPEKCPCSQNQVRAALRAASAKWGAVRVPSRPSSLTGWDVCHGEACPGGPTQLPTPEARPHPAGRQTPLPLCEQWLQTRSSLSPLSSSLSLSCHSPVSMAPIPAPPPVRCVPSLGLSVPVCKRRGERARIAAVETKWAPVGHVLGTQGQAFAVPCYWCSQQERQSLCHQPKASGSTVSPLT